MKILIIDDDVFRNKSFIELMKLTTGWEIIQIGSVDTAILSLQKNSKEFDLILLDIMMPPPENTNKYFETERGNLTGLKLIDYISDELNLNIPIIVLTVLKNLGDILNTKKNVIAYINKPAQIHSIVDIIEKRINNSTNKIELQ